MTPWSIEQLLMPNGKGPPEMAGLFSSGLQARGSVHGYYRLTVDGPLTDCMRPPKIGRGPLQPQAKASGSVTTSAVSNRLLVRVTVPSTAPVSASVSVSWVCGVPVLVLTPME